VRSCELNWMRADERVGGVVLDESVLGELEARRAELRAQHLHPVAERSSPGRGIHHAALICSDVETTIRFYQDVLGFPLVELVENRDYPGSSHFFFDLGNQTLLGFFDFPGLGLEPGIEAIGGVQHIAISMPRDQWEEARKRLDAEGVEYAGPDLGIEESMYFKDPDGIQIELLSDPLMYFAGRRLDE
jgi:glyoxylase I family protein